MLAQYFTIYYCNIVTLRNTNTYIPMSATVSNMGKEQLTELLKNGPSLTYLADIQEGLTPIS